MPPFFKLAKAAQPGTRLPSGNVELAAQRRPRAIPLHQVKRHAAQDCEIVCAVIVAIFLPVLALPQRREEELKTAIWSAEREECRDIFVSESPADPRPRGCRSRA